MTEKLKSKHLTIVKNSGGDSQRYPLSKKPIRISKVKDAKRLLSRLIYEFQQGNITNQDAKDLCYLLISYVNICNQIDLEQRLTDLEERLNEKF